MTDTQALSVLGRLQTWAALKRERAFIRGDAANETLWLCCMENVQGALDLAQIGLPELAQRDHMGVMPVTASTEAER